MKKLLFFVGLVATMVACTESKSPEFDFPDRPDVKPMPGVKIEAVATESNALEFTITPTNAEECAYFCIETEEDDVILTAGDIISKGTKVSATESGQYRIEELNEETSYNVYAAVRKGEDVAMSSVKMTTTAVDEPEPVGPVTNPMYIWVDAAANFPDFANSKDNIRRDLTLAKETGFTDVVVDVRPTNGDVLFESDNCDQVYRSVLRRRC